MLLLLLLGFVQKMFFQFHYGSEYFQDFQTDFLYENLRIKVDQVFDHNLSIYLLKRFCKLKRGH